MIISEHFPSAPLSNYVDTMRYCEGPAQYRQLKILPVPSLTLMINFDDNYQCYKPDQVRPCWSYSESWSSGLWNTYQLWTRPENMQLLMVVFKPTGAYPFLHLPLYELHNDIVSLEAIWGYMAGEIREQLYDAPTIQARFGLLEQLLLARLSQPPKGFDAVQYAVAEIARHHGVLPIRALSDQMGFSQKHLIAQFKQFTGGTPKELARIYRFSHVLYSLDRSQPIEWGEVGYQAGYYDQSHFDQEFKTFTGHTPTDFLRLRRQVHNENPQLDPTYLPVG